MPTSDSSNIRRDQRADAARDPLHVVLVVLGACIPLCACALVAGCLRARRSRSSAVEDGGEFTTVTAASPQSKPAAAMDTTGGAAASPSEVVCHATTSPSHPGTCRATTTSHLGTCRTRRAQIVPTRASAPEHPVLAVPVPVVAAPSADQPRMIAAPPAAVNVRPPTRRRVQHRPPPSLPSSRYRVSPMVSPGRLPEPPQALPPPEVWRPPLRKQPPNPPAGGSACIPSALPPAGLATADVPRLAAQRLRSTSALSEPSRERAQTD
jgi:hypothetical protein